MICKLMGVRYGDEMFRTDGEVVRYTVDCQFEEHRKSRRTSSTVRRLGLIRGGDER